MNESSLSVSEIKKRSVKAFFSLNGRQVALAGISFITINFILASVLPVETLGVFDIAASIITFFTFFSDIGLAASLIQKKDAVTQEDINTVFTIQLAIVGVISLIIIAFASLIGNFYGLHSEGIWLIRALGFSFFLSSLKVVPSVLQERVLNFIPQATVDVVEALLFNILLIILVFKGEGILSFTIATLARGVAGVVLIYILAPIRVGLSLNKGSAQNLLSFGVPYQMNNILALFKDRLVPLLVARMVGPLGIGYIGWSQGIAFLPLQFMGTIIQISFPTFSRLQDDKKSLSVAIEKSLFLTALSVYPIVFGLSAIMPSVIAYVVSPKWQPALLSFYLFSFSTLFSVVSTVFTNALNAMGNVKVTLKLMVFWTIITWILTPAMVYFYGFNGVAISSFLISLTSVATVYLTKRVIQITVSKALILPIIASSIMLLIVYLFSHNFVRDRFSLSIAILLGILSYGISVYLFGKKRIMADIASLRSKS